MNELLFILYVFTVAASNGIALMLGKEALISLTCIQAILVNLFVTKQIALFGLIATASESLAVGLALSLNLLQEYYTKESAKRGLFLSFLGSLFYVCTAYLTVAYTPAVTDSMSTHLCILLIPMPRLIAASLCTYVLVQSADLVLYGILKKLFSGRFFALRNYCTLIITQFIDTVLFSFLGLYRLNASFSSLAIIRQIIITSYTIKLLAILLSVACITLIRTFKKNNH